MDHMELLFHWSLDKDMFNFAVCIEDYHRSGLMLALITSLESPALTHQLLAFSSRHLAHKQPERSTFYCRQAVALQTKVISLFNSTHIASCVGVDHSNCVVILLFASILGHHTLADALAMQTPGDAFAFVGKYV